MTIANDALGGGFPDFLRPALANLLSVTKGACYVCMSSSEWPTLHRVWQEAGGKWSSTIIWAKNTFALGRADYHQQFEAMLYGWKAGAQHYWCGARDQGNVWHFDKPARNDLHPTMKPVALVERAIRNSSKPRDTVLDLLRRLRHDDDRGGAHGAARRAAGDRPRLCRCHRPALAGGDRRGRRAGGRGSHLRRRRRRRAADGRSRRPAVASTSELSPGDSGCASCRDSARQPGRWRSDAAPMRNCDRRARSGTWRARRGSHRACSPYADGSPGRCRHRGTHSRAWKAG